jgi:ABC-type lipoprotein export system ATPase subunit
VGVIGGVKIPVIEDFVIGFKAGFKAAGGNPSSGVLVQYVGGDNPFGDPAKGKQIASAMYGQGAELVWPVAGSSGLGAFESAVAAKRYTFGVDSDQYKTLTDRPAADRRHLDPQERGNALYLAARRTRPARSPTASPPPWAWPRRRRLRRQRQLRQARPRRRARRTQGAGREGQVRCRQGPFGLLTSRNTGGNHEETDETIDTAPLALEAVGLGKTYPNGTRAVSDVDLSVPGGEIRAIVGQNGAGKSTLMKLLYGLEQPSAGHIRVHGERVRFAGPQDAIALGVGMVHQNLMLVPSFTIAENVVLGVEPSRAGRAASTARPPVERTAALAAESGLAVDPEARVDAVSVGMRQRAEILKACTAAPAS